MKRKILSPSDYLRKILGPAVEYAARQMGLDVVGNTKARASASYGGTGNIPVTLPHETSVAAGAKTQLTIQHAGSRNAAVIAGDPLALAVDRNNNRWVVGKFVPVGASITDSEYLMGLRPVAPGNTLLTFAGGGNHDAEINTTSATLVDTINKFHVTRPGEYRMKVELARSGGTARVRAVRKLKDGTVVPLTTEGTQITLTYPTFGAVITLDFTGPVDWGDVIYMQLANDSGPAQTAYCKNCRLYYADAVDSLTIYDAAL